MEELSTWHLVHTSQRFVEMNVTSSNSSSIISTRTTVVGGRMRVCCVSRTAVPKTVRERKERGGEILRERKTEKQTEQEREGCGSNTTVYYLELSKCIYRYKYLYF